MLLTTSNNIYFSKIDFGKVAPYFLKNGETALGRSLACAQRSENFSRNNQPHGLIRDALFEINHYNNSI